MKTIIITENQLQLIKKSEQKINMSEEDFNEYIAEEDELIEYTFIDKNRYGLPVNCFADDDGAYKCHNHPLWFLMINNYGNDSLDMLPLSIDDNPNVLVSDYNLHIKESDFEIIKNFIRINKDAILQLSNGTLINTAFLNTVKCPVFAESTEKTKPLIT
jgi:hypothetical protein